MTTPDLDALDARLIELHELAWRSPTGLEKAIAVGIVQELITTSRSLIAEVRELRRQRDEARAALEAIVPDGLAHVVGDRLIIAWTLDGLAVGSTTGPYFDRIFAETAEEPVITDKVMWGHELTRKLNEESEDGTTAIHRMMDGAAERAFEDGAEGIEVRSRSALPPPAGSEPAP